MSTDFKLTLHADYVHVALAPGFKDVAQNRGVRIEFFGEREAALSWLGLAPSP